MPGASRARSVVDPPREWCTRPPLLTFARFQKRARARAATHPPTHPHGWGGPSARTLRHTEPPLHAMPPGGGAPALQAGAPALLPPPPPPGVVPAGQAAAAGPAGDEPARVLYQHLHDAIRGELAALVAGVAGLEGGADGSNKECCAGTTTAAPPAPPALTPAAALASVRARCRFLARVYKYHSAVEDEVRREGKRRGRERVPARCPRTAPDHRTPARGNRHSLSLTRTHPLPPQVIYPALDARVSNVTPAYTVEHEDEVRGVRNERGKGKSARTRDPLSLSMPRRSARPPSHHSLSHGRAHPPSLASLQTRNASSMSWSPWHRTRRPRTRAATRTRRARRSGTRGEEERARAAHPPHTHPPRDLPRPPPPTHTPTRACALLFHPL